MAYKFSVSGVVDIYLFDLLCSIRLRLFRERTFELLDVLVDVAVGCLGIRHVCSIKQVYERAVQKGLRDRGVVNRLSWAKMPVAEPGMFQPFFLFLFDRFLRGVSIYFCSKTCCHGLVIL